MNKLLGLSLLVILIVTLAKQFTPAFQQEVGYKMKKVETFSKTEIRAITPVDTDFGIVIPKIDANSAIVKDVDPYDELAYTQAFTAGIAHVKGSVMPGQKGNIFLFAQNSADSFKSSKFNQTFYLLNKMEAGDEIYLYYGRKKYVYIVTDKKIVARSTVEYLSDDKSAETITLMTTYPPATSLMRVLVHATLQKI